MAAGNHKTRRALVVKTLPTRTITQITEARIRQHSFGDKPPNWQKYERGKK